METKSLLHHVSLPVNDLTRSAALFDAALGALGYSRVSSGTHFVGYGVVKDQDKFALMQTAQAQSCGPGLHIAFSAPTRAAVDIFHRLALESGGRDNGAPGLRPHYGESYYAAFIIDPDGHHIEAVINQPPL